MRLPLRPLGTLLSLGLLVAACAPAPRVQPTAALTAVPAKPTEATTTVEKLVIAVQPTASPEQLSADARDLQQFLQQRLGRPVELVFPTTFAGVIEALRFGHAQAAFMSAWPAALAQKHAGAEVVLAEVREVLIEQDKREEPFYFSYWVVPKDSPIRSIQELRGKKVALPSALSTSGYVAPMARLVELGLLPGGQEADPRQFFSEVLFAGGYAQAWEALKAGQVDASVIAGDVSESLYRQVLDNTQVIEQQGPIPSHGVVFAKQLHEPARSQLKEALLELGKPEQRALMRKFISGIFVGFRPTTPQEHLGSLSRYLETTQLAFTERLR
jgi:phosphonate transport system substrate-binding protein